MRLELNDNVTNLLMLISVLLFLLAIICIPTYLYTLRVTTALTNGYEETKLVDHRDWTAWVKARK